MNKILIILASLLATTVLPMTAQDAATPDSVTVMQDTPVYTKVAGDSAYVKGDYATAIAIYEELLKTGEAPEVYYNLAGSYYKSDEIARAILNYERALLLDPGSADIRANLEIARAKTVDKITPIPELFIVSWFKSLASILSIDAWAVVAVVAFILLLCGMLLYFFSKQTKGKKIGFFSAVVCLLVVILANVFASTQKTQLTQRDQAIILQPAVTVRSTPSETGTSLFVLHEGHKVSIKDDSMSQWKEIKLEDGKVGWVPTTALEKI